MSSASSLDDTAYYIRTLEPWFQPYALYLVNAVRAAGVPLVVISGRRGAARNESVGGAPFSLHLTGRAFDVDVIGYDVEEIPFWWWEILGRFWEAMGGRWGGRFSRPDVNHFDSGQPFAQG